MRWKRERNTQTESNFPDKSGESTLYGGFEKRGEECATWAEKMEKKGKSSAAVSWYIRSYFAFMRAQDAKKGKEMMRRAIKLQDGRTFSLAQCFLQLTLAKLKLEENPMREVAKGRELLEQGVPSVSNPFLPLKKKHEGISSAFKIVSLIQKNKIEKARNVWQRRKREILASWNWYRRGMERILSDFLERTPVKEAIKAFNEGHLRRK